MVAVNVNIKELAWLLGKWVGKKGSLYYPTIKSLQFNENLNITHIGQPNLHYDSTTFNAETNVPMHRECGFIRLSSNKETLALIIAQSSGISTIEEAKLTPDNTLTFESQNIGGMSFGKDPRVTKIKRVFKLEDANTLSQEVFMATTNTPHLTSHLKIQYKRDN